MLALLLEATEEKSRIQIRIWSRIQIRNPAVTDPRIRIRIKTIKTVGYRYPTDLV